MAKVFAIGDLHLSFASAKPMDVFGPEWERHSERVEAAWRGSVGDGDTVIVAGDISWALKTEDALPDIAWIHALPGHKILIRGNHDLWWQGVKRLNALHGDIRFLQNDCVRIGDRRVPAERGGDAEAGGDRHPSRAHAPGIDPGPDSADAHSPLFVCGSRGWGLPGLEDYGHDDERILAREVQRLTLSLDAAAKAGAERILVAVHFPPALAPAFRSPFTDLFESYPQVRDVVYGHLHGAAAFKKGIQGPYRGINYRLVSLDRLDCRPAFVAYA